MNKKMSYMITPMNVPMYLINFYILTAHVKFRINTDIFRPV
jgi:hypothetical protein